MVCIICSNCPFEIESCFLSKETHPTKVVIVFWTLVYEPPKRAKIKHEYWATLDINWTEKYQPYHVTSSCWFDLPMPVLFPLYICFQFFWEKIFFFCTSEMTIKCAYLHLQSWNLVQMKANEILFILAFFLMPYDTWFKSNDHLTESPHFMQKWNILNWQLPPLEFRKHWPA